MTIALPKGYQEKRLEVPDTVWRATQFSPDSYNEEKRTIDLVWTTGAMVRRFSWAEFEMIEEVLSLRDEDVNLARMLSGGMTFLKDHRNSVDQILGRVVAGGLRDATAEERAIMDVDRLGWATVRLTTAKDAEPAIHRLLEGTSPNISVGYSIGQMREITAKGAQLKRYEAIDWTPQELSNVAVPADFMSMVRGQDTGERPASRVPVFIRAASDEDKEVDPKDKPRGTEEPEVRTEPAPEPAPTPAPTPSPEPDTSKLEAEREAGRKLEAERRSKVGAMCRAAQLSEEQTATLVDDFKMTEDVASARIFDIMEKRTQETGPGPNGPVINITEDARDKFRSAMEDSICMRYLIRGKPKPEDVHPGAAELNGMSLVRMTEEMLVRQGVKLTSRSPDELFTRAMSSADFPLIMANVLNKELQPFYRATPVSWKPMSNRRDLPDFKLASSTRLSSAPGFEKLPEGAAISIGKLTEAGETYGLSTFARAMTFTRVSFINDDLGALTDFAQMYGISWARLQNGLGWLLLTSPLTMGDGATLFHADHGNVGTGEDIDEAGFTAMFTNYGNRTDGDGNPITLMPSFVAAPPVLRTKLLKILTQTTPADTTDVNVHAGSVTPIIEPLLKDAPTRWFGCIAPGDGAQAMRHGHLEGMGDMPVVRSVERPSTLGVEIQAYGDFYATVMDWVGFWRNTAAY